MCSFIEGAGVSPLIDSQSALRIAFEKLTNQPRQIRRRAAEIDALAAAWFIRFNEMIASVGNRLHIVA